LAIPLQNYDSGETTMKKNLLSTLFLIALLLAACGQQPTVSPTSNPPTETPLPPATSALENTSTPESSPISPELASLIAAAQQEGELNVIALPNDWMNYGEIITTFAKKYGIVVNQLNPGASSAEELDTIRRTKTNDRESAPDVVDIGLPFAVQAKQDELLQPYQVSTWSTIPSDVKDPDGYWYGDYYGLIVFEVNTKFVSTPPQDWADLLNSDYKVAMAGSPSASYHAMMTVYSASLANGGSLDDTLPGLRFFQQINRNDSLLDIRFDRDTIVSGETPIALNWDYLALANQQYYSDYHPDSDIQIILPKSGNVAGLYTQGISAYAPHPNAAKLWMEFLYSDEGQLLFLKGLGHPVRFADLSGRGVIPVDILNKLLPPEPYLNALFPSSEQLNVADKSILGGWDSYVP
jgi:putative spermidine/putrescine transport system substrate-binding protein